MDLPAASNAGRLVSVIIPCYNEQATICLLLHALYQQSFPIREMEVIVADGMSTDLTRQEIATFQSAHPDLDVRVIDNPKRSIPSGLNRAIEASCGQYIIRLDAHSAPRSSYVERCIQSLQRRLGDNVGGVWEIQPGAPGAMARSIAAAASHPLGVGDALYRYSERAGEVDTVPFGAFRKDLVKRVGGFDENLLTNEDYEFNVRIRRSGGKIWLDPEIRSTYFARATLGDLARQYWRYGYWKGRMLARYPDTLRWRQALPPLFVLSLVGLSLLSIWLHQASWLLLVELALYAIILLGASTSIAIQKRDPVLTLGLPLAIACMHVTWGAAFIFSLGQQAFTRLRHKSYPTSF